MSFFDRAMVWGGCLALSLLLAVGCSKSSPQAPKEPTPGGPAPVPARGTTAGKAGCAPSRRPRKHRDTITCPNLPRLF